MDKEKAMAAAKSMNVWIKVYNILPRHAQVQLTQALTISKDLDSNEKAAKQIIAKLDPYTKKRVQELLND